MTADQKDEYRLLLLAMFLDAEDQAVTGLETCTYPGGIFNDAIWRADHPGDFKLMRRVRRALGLKAFSHRDAKRSGLADDRLAVLRSKEREMVRRLR